MAAGMVVGGVRELVEEAEKPLRWIDSGVRWTCE
jgi:hypothetical protein